MICKNNVCTIEVCFLLFFNEYYFWLTGTWRFRYNLPSYLIKNVTERGYHHPTAVQMQAIPVMMHVSASLHEIGV